MGGTVIEHLQECPLVKGITAYDVRDTRLREVKEKYGVSVQNNLDAVLSDRSIPLVFVTASDDAHAQLTLAALKAGKAVMCEKPMATTLADAEAMVETAERLNGFLQIGFELRYSKLYTTIKQWIDQGLLGEVVNTHCFYICNEFWRKQSWRCTNPGGMFGEKLSHYVDLPRWWIGSRVTEVYSACAPNAIEYFQVHDNFHTTYRFANGAVSHLTFMMAPAATFRGDPLQDLVGLQNHDGHSLRFLIQGTHGAAETDVFGRTIKRWAFGEAEDGMTSDLVETLTWQRPDDHAHFHNTRDQAHDIVRRVAEGLEPMTPPRDSLETMRVVFAAEQSADLGRVVQLGETRQNDQALEPVSFCNA